MASGWAADPVHTRHERCGDRRRRRSDVVAQRRPGLRTLRRTRGSISKGRSWGALCDIGYQPLQRRWPSCREPEAGPTLHSIECSRPKRVQHMPRRRLS